MRTTQARLTALAAGLVLMLVGLARAEDTFADDVKAACKDFKDTYKKKADDEVRASIDALLAMYKDEKADEDAKKDLVSHIGLAVRVRSDEVASHALKALGDTDEDALKYLDPSLKSALKSKPPAVDRYEACFEAMGKIASARSIKVLTGYLKYKDYDVIAQSARALMGFKDARSQIRKDIFEELLKVSEGLYSSATSNPNSEPAKKWRVIGSAMTDAMKAISHEELDNPAAARKWFNDNKKRDWDKLE